MKHQERHPHLDTPGCYGCRIATVSFGAVAGGTRPAGRNKAFIQKREKGLVKYADRRKAGEQPDGTTLEKIEQYDKRVGTFEKLEKNLVEDNPPERIDNLRKSTFNK